jgi:hypothetical protein
MNTIILKLLTQRIALALLSLLAVSVVVFAITAVLPGDAAQEQLGQDATPEALAALRAQMGLDIPAPQRYLKWLGGLVTGDMGQSSTTQMAGVAIGGFETAQLAAARRHHRAVLGSHRTHRRHLCRRVARIVVRPGRLQCRGGGRLGA